MAYAFKDLRALSNAIVQLGESAGDRVVVGIDGCGGAGKSTLARALCQELPGCQIIQTDEFASWQEPLDWWPRMLEQVFLPLSEGRPARYRRYDWVSQSLEEWVEVRGRILLVEGVSSTRREFRPFLAARIWVECPRALRLERGLLRDGSHAISNWESWMAAEDLYREDHQPEQVADFTIHGGP